MTVEEILQLPSFEGAQVVAGAGGCSNEVTSAMVLEATDIEKWGKPGQLIITSFFAFERLTSTEIVQFFRTMSVLRIAGMAFKPERLISEAPARIVELCEDLELPLIRLSADVKYEAILLDVLGHVLDSNLTLLNRFYEAHQHVMALALRQPSMPQILSSLKTTLKYEVSYLDTARDRRVGTDPERTTYTGYSFERRDPGMLQTHAYFSMRLFYDKGYGAKKGATISEEALAVRIPSTDGNEHFLIIHNEGKDLTALDTMTVENIVSLLQMEIIKHNAVKQRIFFQNNNSVHDLLLNRYPNNQRIDMALQGLNIDQYPLYECMLVRLELEDPTDLDRYEELHQAVRRRLRPLYPGLVYFINGERAVYIHNFRSKLSGIDLDAVERVMNDLHAFSSLPLFRHLVALSNPCDRYSISHANDEVLNIYRLFDGHGEANRCIRFSDLGVYKLLLQAKNPSELNGYIDSRLEKLRAENPEIFHTVVAICKNGYDYTATAHELFVHPKTVRYRVERARDLVGIDVKNPDDYLQIVLSSKILSITDPSDDGLGADK